MAVCISVLGAIAFMAFGPDRLVIRLVALTTFGVGLGLFMAPNADAPILVPGSPVNVPMLEAVESGLLLLSGLAVVAAAVSLLRRDSSPAWQRA